MTAYEEITQSYFKAHAPAVLEQGIGQGINQKALDVARLMLQNNEPLDKIMLYTGLSKGEIAQL